MIPLGRPRHEWENMEWILEKQRAEMSIGCIWLRIGTRGGMM